MAAPSTPTIKTTSGDTTWASGSVPSQYNAKYPIDDGNASSARTVVNALKDYNPKRYSGKILRKFYEACVLTQISNTDYEGEIRAYGDTVVIRTTPDIKVEDYKKGQDLTYRVYQTDSVELYIDKGKYWAFTVNPIDTAQTDIKSFTDKWTSEAALRIKIAIEKDVYTYLVGGNAGVLSANSGTSAGKVSGNINLGSTAAAISVDNTNIVAKILDCGTVLAEQDIPVQSESCWMVVTQKVANLLANSELKNAMIAGDGKSSLVLRGGQYNVPKIDCFDIYRSNILAQLTPHSGDSSVNYEYVLFGHNSALTFASQITENEVIPNPTGFGKLHRGLMVYGFKLVQPKAFGYMVIVPGTVKTAAQVNVQGDVAVANSTTAGKTKLATTPDPVTVNSSADNPVYTQAVTA